MKKSDYSPNYWNKRINKLNKLSKAQKSLQNEFYNKRLNELGIQESLEKTFTPITSEIKQSSDKNLENLKTIEDNQRLAIQDNNQRFQELQQQLNQQLNLSERQRRLLEEMFQAAQNNRLESPDNIENWDLDPIIEEAEERTPRKPRESEYIEPEDTIQNFNFNNEFPEQKKSNLFIKSIIC